jgi:hypothetical protein
MQRAFWAFAAAFTLALSPTASARAATIDTTGSDTGTVIQFGAPDTATYGQTFTAPGTVLDSFSLFLRNRFTGAGSLDLRGYVAAWNGLMASSIQYESSTRTMNAGGALQQFDFSPNLALTPGNQYVAFLSIVNLQGQPESNFGMPHGIDQIPGEFVFPNNGNSPNEWTTSPWTLGWIGQNDVWFEAAFDLTRTPERATLLLAGTTLAGLGLTHRRRNRASR